MHHPDAYMTGMPIDKERKAHTVLDIDGWILWYWDDDAKSESWHLPYAMFHRCGRATAHNPQNNGVKKNGYDVFVCSRCALSPPDGLVACYELMNWEAKGYG